MRGLWPLCLGLLAVVGVARTQVPADAECEQAVTIGFGSGSLVRWTYDKSQKQCKTFITKDSQIVSNVFLTEEECLRRCSAEYNQLFPSGDSAAAACELPRDPGPCLAHIIMWHYDQQKEGCDTFIWGGCQGNGNRFESIDDCRSLCIIKKGKAGGGTSDVSESQSDAGLIIGVVFGVLFGVAFLVTLAMYLVQRKKMKKQKHKKVPDTEMK